MSALAIRAHGLKMKFGLFASVIEQFVAFLKLDLARSLRPYQLLPMAIKLISSRLNTLGQVGNGLLI